MIAYPPPENRQVSDVWSSLGGDLKPSVDLVITMAIQPDTLYEIAQAVMAPLRLRAVGHTTYDVEDDIRHLPDLPNRTRTWPPASPPAGAGTRGRGRRQSLAKAPDAKTRDARRQAGCTGSR